MSTRADWKYSRNVLPGWSATELAADDTSRKEHTGDRLAGKTAGGVGPFPVRREIGHRSTTDVPEGQTHKHSVR